MSAEANAALLGGLFAAATLGYQAFTTNRTKRVHNHRLRRLLLTVRKASWPSLPGRAAAGLASFLARTYDLDNDASLDQRFTSALRVSGLIAVAYIIGLLLFIPSNMLQYNWIARLFSTDLPQSATSITVALGLIYMLKRFDKENFMSDFLALPPLSPTARWKFVLYGPVLYFVFFALYTALATIVGHTGPIGTIIWIEFILFTALAPLAFAFRYRSAASIFVPRMLLLATSYMYCAIAYLSLQHGPTDPLIATLGLFLAWTAFVLPMAASSERVHRYSFYCLCIIVAVGLAIPVSGPWNPYNFAVPATVLAALWFLTSMNAIFDTVSVLISHRLLSDHRKFSRYTLRTLARFLLAFLAAVMIYIISTMIFAILIAGCFWVWEQSTSLGTISQSPRSGHYFELAVSAWLPVSDIATLPADTANFLKSVKYLGLSSCVPIFLAICATVLLATTKVVSDPALRIARAMHRLLVDEKVNEVKSYTNYLRTSSILGATVSVAAYLLIKAYDSL